MTTLHRPAGRTDDEQRDLVRFAAAGVLLGTIGLFLEEAGVDPLTAVWFRSAFGALALTAWLAATGRLGELRLARGERVPALSAGALMLASWALFFAAIERSSIALATVVVHVQPFWVMALGALVLGERVGTRQWQAAGVALCGLTLASGLAGSAAGVPGGGLLLALGSSLLYAGAALLARRARSVGALAMAWWQCAVGSVAFVGWPLVHGGPDGLAWGWLAALGVLHTGLAYVLWYGGVARLCAGRVAVLQFVYPGTAVLVDAFVYGRWLDRLQWVGVLLMVLGLVAARPASR